jgi:Uma2 family endonuclease
MSTLPEGYVAPPRGEDLPYSDGVPMESQKHVQQMTDLIQSLKLGMPREDVFIGGNMFLYFSQLQSRRNDFRGPDVFVVVGVDPHERRSWVVWEEDGRAPDLIIELLSGSTEAEDRGRKMEVYAGSLRVPEYYLFDPVDGRLEAYALQPGDRRYTRRQPSSAHRFQSWSTQLELGVAPDLVSYGIRGPWLRWFKPDGSVVPTPIELMTQEQQRADQEQQRADQERERADALAAELARLKGTSP